MLGKQVQRVAEDTFSGDTSLEKVSFAAGLMGIAENAFKNCSALTDVVLDDNLTTIGREAFYGCTALQNVVLPQTVTQVGARAFEGTAYLDGLAGEFVTAGNGVLLAYPRQRHRGGRSRDGAKCFLAEQYCYQRYSAGGSRRPLGRCV